MFKYFVVVIFVILTGCSFTGKKTEIVKQEEAEDRIQIEKRNQRVESLKKMMLTRGYMPELLINAKSMYHVMSAFQDGKVTGDSMKGFSYFLFLEDPLGIDNFSPNLSTYFQCTQVIPLEGTKDTDGTEIKVYKALYTNPRVTLTVSVYWYDIRPLVGQKLNTDFLLFLDVGEYETEGGGVRSEVKFIRPSWAH